jgi:hypothetical protein
MPTSHAWFEIKKEQIEVANRGGLFVLCDRQDDGDDHPTVFASANDALLGFSGLHRNRTDWAGFRRYIEIEMWLHTTCDGD